MSTVACFSWAEREEVVGFSAIVQLALWHIDGRDKGAGNKGER